MFSRTATKHVLFALSALSLVACGGAAGGAGADAMKYLPEGSVGVAVIDVKKMLASPLANEEPFKSQIAAMKEEKDLKEFTASGMDPFSNVNSVVLAGNPAKEQGVAIVTGTFDAAKFAEAAKAKLPSDAAIEVVGPNMVIIGEKASVASAKAGKGLDGSPEVKNNLALVDNTKAFFAVGSVPGEMIPPMVTMMVPSAKNLKAVGMSLDASAGIDLKIVARFASDADATSLKTMFDTQASGALKQQGGDLANSLKVEAKGADLNVSINMNTAQVKEAVAKMQGLMGMMGGGMGGSMPPMPMPEMPAPMPMPDPAAPGAAPGAAPVPAPAPAPVP